MEAVFLKNTMVGKNLCWQDKGGNWRLGVLGLLLMLLKAYIPVPSLNTKNV
jgi:hypothetical protein